MPSLLDLTKDEAESLMIVDIYVDSSSHSGVTSSSGTPNLRKNSVVRGEYKQQSIEPTTARAKAAFRWLCDNNDTYSRWHKSHETWLSTRSPGDERYIKTLDLLLNSPGIEVAFRPWLYPFASYGDTDLKKRLQLLERADSKSQPSMKDSFFRKLCCRIRDYSYDFLLQCLMLDINAARSFMAIMNRAEELKCPPEIIAVGNHSFDVYWENQARFLNDRCRQLGLPTIFLTISPLEWKFPLHSPLFARFRKHRD